MPTATRSSLSPRAKLGIALLLAFGVLLVCLRLFVIRAFQFPTSGMAPAIEAGDQVLCVSYLLSAPRRGEILVFKTDGIPAMPAYQASTILAKRLAGEPGDRLRLVGGQLYVNDVHTALSNVAGEITYASLPNTRFLTSPNDTMTVPAGHYFVLGDNTTNSFDGRFWGFVPAGNVLGRITVCYWPPNRTGPVQ